jgi:type I restriction enzyme, S subunit
LNLRPLKYFCDGRPLYGLNVPAEMYVGSGVRFLRTTDVGNDGRLATGSTGVYLDGAVVPSEYFLRDGDLLFSRSGTLGRCLLFRTLSEPSTHAGYLVRFRPNGDSWAPYLAYCAQSHLMQDAILADAIESTIGNFNAEKYANVRLPSWPRQKQRSIADYLDRETARIDALIVAKERLVHLAEERFAASAMETLFGDPRVARVPLKRLATCLAGFSFPSEGFTADPDDSIRLLRGVNVTPMGLRWEDVVYWPTTGVTPQLGGYEVAAGDLVVGMDRTWIGSGARSRGSSQRISRAC